MTLHAVRLERHPARPVAVVRRVAKQSELPKVITEACGLVWNLLKAQHAKGGRHVAIYHDMVMTVDIGVEALSEFTEQGELRRSELPAGLIATTTHFGPYGELGRAHDAIHEWGKANGKEFVRPCWETYGHWESAWDKNPALIRTDVSYLVRG